jgi:hypothetical protein
MRIRDPGWRQFGSGIWDGKKSDPGSGSRIRNTEFNHTNGFLLFAGWLTSRSAGCTVSGCCWLLGDRRQGGGGTQETLHLKAGRAGGRIHGCTTHIGNGPLFDDDN